MPTPSSPDRPQLKPALIANWYLWPAAQLVNFTVVPLDQRILYVNAVSIAWTAYISNMASSGPGEAPAQAPERAQAPAPAPRTAAAQQRQPAAALQASQAPAAQARAAGRPRASRKPRGGTALL